MALDFATKKSGCTFWNVISKRFYKKWQLFFFKQEIMVAGGQESMSNVPFYVKREPLKYGGNTMLVSIFSLLKYIYFLMLTLKYN